MSSSTTTTTRCGIYPCRHHLGSGHLYVGSTAVSFVHATSCKRVIGPIEFVSIAEIKDFNDTSICVTTVNGDEWIFDDFQTNQKETILETLTEFVNKKDEDIVNIVDSPNVAAASGRKLLTRSNSLPSFTKDHDGITPIIVSSDDEDDPVMAAMADLGNASFAIRQQKKVYEKETQEKQQEQRPSIDRRRDSISKSMRMLSATKQDQSPKQLKEAWTKLQKDKSIAEVAVKSTELPLPYDSFYKTFWSSHAKHPISVYQKNEIGDEDIETLDWMQDGSSLVRSIEYMHPSTAPMGPPMAKTTKEQVLQKFDNLGMVLQTTTIVQDVPMADCFVLEDRIWVTPSSNNNTTVKCCFNVKFVKSTMWKKIIMSNAKKGITSWMEGYAKYLKKQAAAAGPLQSVKE